MNSQELETAVRVGAPLIVLVLADCSYSLIHHSQRNKKLPNYGVDFNPIDSLKTAQACGVPALRVTDGATLAGAVKEAVAGNQSLVVEVPIELDAYQGLV
jgi:acetolactate synthase-1/2/3 large subunit